MTARPLRETRFEYRPTNGSLGVEGATVLGSEARGVLFSDADIAEPLDAVLLLKRTGTLLGAWTRRPADLEVLSVMTATLLGSVEIGRAHV